MKVAHFGAFAPNQSGQYETVKELIRAEREIGLDAQFIDFGYNGKAISRSGLRDGDIETVNLDWAKRADVMLRHSDVPRHIMDKNIPLYVCLHGRPENSFLLEKYGFSPVISEILKTECKGFITFWDEHKYVWEKITGKEVRVIPAPVDLKKYNPEGKRHIFDPSGRPNIVIVDMWREDMTPFNAIFAAAYFRDAFCKTAKIHLYGMNGYNAFDNLQDQGAFGEVWPQVQGLQYVYRAADILVTPQTIATRSVREALASGLPIVAASGNPYTNYRSDFRDIRKTAEVINECWTHQLTNREQMKIVARRTAEQHFNPVESAKALRKILE